MRQTIILTIMLFISNYIKGQTPGVAIFYEQYVGDDREYIEYIPGNLPIIISAPHGGVKQSGSTVGGTFYPDNDTTLPDRNCGTNERDDNTDILVREIQSEIFDLTGCYAHVIINNLHRSKLDPNREEGEAACSDSDALDHWNAFHDFIDDASASVESNWGKGLFLDVHGQSHSIPRIEIGYNVSANDINNTDLNLQNIIDNSTIKNLVTANLNGLTHEELITGTNSLGELFQEASGTFYAAQNYPGCSHNGTHGYRAIPSNTDTGGQSCDDTQPHNYPYFDGDFYNNRRHGSGSGANNGSGTLVGGGGSIDGIMTEVNRRVRDLGTYMGNVYDNKPQTLVPFAMDYAEVLLTFMDTHYNDFTHFNYGECVFSLEDSNPTPMISGINDGVFSSEPSLAIDSETGEIDLSITSEGSYTITYSGGDCGYYNSTQTIEIKSGTVGFVDISSTGDHTGNSWTNAYQNLEAALTSGCIYDTIKIATGTYIPETTDRNYKYPFYSNLVIQGGYASGGTDFLPSQYPVILNADIGLYGDDTDNLYHAIFVDEDIIDLHLSYLDITNGYADNIGENAQGAGIFNKGDILLKHVNLNNNKSIFIKSTIHNQGNIELSEHVILENNSSI